MLEQVLKIITEFALDSGIRFVGAIIILIVGLKLIKVLIKVVSKGREFSKIDPGAQSFLKSFISISLKIILIVTVATLLGVPMTSMVAVLGSAGLAIGLALQGSLSNFAGGVIILIFKPFVVGDFITVGTASGTVKSIDIFYTKIVTPDNKRIVIPNGSITNQSVIDASAYPTRMVEIEFSVAYDSDIKVVKEILMSIANEHPLVLDDPAPFVALSRCVDSALIFVSRLWCNSEDYLTVSYDVTETVKNEFDNNNISIPFPQLDVHLTK